MQLNLATETFTKTSAKLALHLNDVIYLQLLKNIAHIKTNREQSESTSSCSAGDLEHEKEVEILTHNQPVLRLFIGLNKKRI